MGLARPAAPAQYRAIEALNLPPAPSRASSESSVTSPLSEAPTPLAVRMEHLAEFSRGSVLRGGVPRGGARSLAGSQPQSIAPSIASPASRPSSATGSVRVRLNPSQRASRNAGATVRDQMVVRPITSAELSREVLRNIGRASLWILPSVGISVGLIIGFLPISLVAAIANGVVCGLVSVAVSASAIARAIDNVARFSAERRRVPERINLDTLRLEKEIEFWFQTLGRPLVLEPWHVDRSPAARRFAVFLGKIEVSRDYRDPRTRPAMQARVYTLLDSMSSSRSLRQAIFELADEACTSCGDRVVLGLNNMELAIQNHRAESGRLSETDLLDLGRGLFRLDNLEKFAFKAGMLGCLPSQDDPTPDDVETILNLQERLRESLQLPIPSFSLASGSSAVTFLRVRQARRAVQAHDYADFHGALEEFRRGIDILRSGRLEALPAPQWPELALFLATQYHPWGKHVARKYPVEFYVMRERVRSYQAFLEENFWSDGLRLDRYGGVGYDELSRRAMFYFNYGLAFERALTALIDRATPARRTSGSGSLLDRMPL